MRPKHFKKEIVRAKEQRDFANSAQQEKRSGLHVAAASEGSLDGKTGFVLKDSFHKQIPKKL
jgi:hypothetical protein